MVSITEVNKRINKTTGEEFVSLTLVGDLQIVKSRTGKTSARVPKINYPLAMTLEQAVSAKIVPGKEMKGELEFTTVSEYEFTNDKGENLTSTRGVRFIDQHGEVFETVANTSNPSPNGKITAPSADDLMNLEAEKAILGS